MVTLQLERCIYIHSYGIHASEQCARRNTYGEFCISHKDYKNGKCSAILEQGVNKGKQCSRPCLEDSKVCGKHLTFAKVSEYTLIGKVKCFTRRCTEAVDKPKSYCLKCKERKASVKKCKAIIAQGVRKGQQCNNSAEGIYCEKHSEHYTLLEIAKVRNMNICGKGLRCSELIPKYKFYCDTCSEARCNAEKIRYDERTADVTRCCDCGKMPEEFATNLSGIKSRYCKDCFIKMRCVEDRRDRSVEKESITNPELNYSRYKNDAKRRDLLFELSYLQFMNIVARPCNYCGEFNELSYNGVDRQNNTIGYNISNCVPACSMCNLMKSSHEVCKFISHCKAIAEFQTIGSTEQERLVWNGTNYTTFDDYKRVNTTRRRLDFTIDEKKYITLKNSPCYLCGQKPPKDSYNGIDRVDPAIGYEETNCAPCCVYCNRMKNDYLLEKFLDKCHQIANKT